MSDVTLAKELKRLLANPPFGGPAALAQAMRVKDPSVSAWRQGHSTPRQSRWTELEDYLSLPRGYLDRAYHGDIDTDIQAVWPEVRHDATERSERKTANDDELSQLRDDVAHVRHRVAQLARVIRDQLGADVGDLDETPPAGIAADR